MTLAGGAAETGLPLKHTNSLHFCDDRTLIYVRKKAPELRGKKIITELKAERKKQRRKERGESWRKEDKRKEAWEETVAVTLGLR